MLSPGDVVAEDQTLVDVMTDKATVELTSPVTGTVVKVNGNVGDQAPVGSTLVELEVEGQDTAEPEMDVTPPEPAVADQAPPTKPAVHKQPPPAKPQTAKPAPAINTRTFGEAPLAAPATRRRAYELGIHLQFVPGTGSGGRITPADLEAYIDSGGNAPVNTGRVKRTAVNEQKIVGLRRKIAEKMQESKRRIPHFGFVEELDLTDLEALRRELNSERSSDGVPKLTLLPFFMRAIAQLQSEFPQINAHYDDEAQVLYRHEGVHVGIATQTPGGLMVPVVRHVESLDIWIVHGNWCG